MNAAQNTRQVISRCFRCRQELVGAKSIVLARRGDEKFEVERGNDLPGDIDDIAEFCKPCAHEALMQ